MNLEDEWTLANVIDAAVDEQRRRLGQDPLPPRDDSSDTWPADQDGRRWPSVCDTWSEFSGSALVDELALQDVDLRTIVINVFESLKSRFVGSQNVAIGANALISTTGSHSVALGASALSTSNDNDYTVVGHNATCTLAPSKKP